MKQRILFCTDLSYQVYRATASHPKLTCDGVFTGGLFGFFHSFAKAVRETRATDVVFCQDRKPYVRSIAYPEYKTLRKKNQDPELLEAYQESMPLVLSVLSGLGYEPWGVDGYESDDMIGYAALKYRNRFHHIYAGSNDSDLYQLFGLPNFSVYAKDIADVMNGKRLLEATGLKPHEFMLATALQGTHNDIAGIAGVGVKTAIKAVLSPSLLREYRAKYSDIIDRNLSLIQLPHQNFPGARLPTFKKDFDYRTLYKLLGAYDIAVSSAMVDAFEQLAKE